MPSKIPSSSQTPGFQQWLYLALSFGLSMGVVYSIQQDNWINGMSVGLFSGVIFATMMRWFAVRQVKRFSLDRPALDGETVLFEGPANHFEGAESVGGYLWLTSEQLFFRSHQFNFQNHECKILLEEISSVECYKTLGMIPNGLSLHLVSGSHEKFVVHRNSMWVKAVRDAKG